MKIEIAERYRPFSHQPGASCLLPGTCVIVQAFPTLLRLDQETALSLQVSGPVREFTLEQDLEKGVVRVWGVAQEGGYRLRIEPGICLIVERAPAGGLSTSRGLLQKGDRVVLQTAPRPAIRPPQERLSLGCHRAQDWDRVRRRFDAAAVLPILFHLSQWLPSLPTGPLSPMHGLLERGFEPFFQAALTGICAPRLFDEEHQGLIAHAAPEGAVAASLIESAGKKIRSLFLEQEGERIRLASPSFPFGRLVNWKLEGIGAFDLEWSKGTLRQATLRAEQDVTVCFVLPKPLSSFRLRRTLAEKGKRGGEETLTVKKGEIYFLDRFQK